MSGIKNEQEESKFSLIRWIEAELLAVARRRFMISWLECQFKEQFKTHKFSFSSKKESEEWIRLAIDSQGIVAIETKHRQYCANRNHLQLSVPSSETFRVCDAEWYSWWALISNTSPTDSSCYRWIRCSDIYIYRSGLNFDHRQAPHFTTIERLGFGLSPFVANSFLA